MSDAADDTREDEDVQVDEVAIDMDVSVDRRTFLKLLGMGIGGATLGAYGVTGIQKQNMLTGRAADCLIGGGSNSGNGGGGPGFGGGSRSSDIVEQENSQSGSTAWSPQENSDPQRRLEGYTTTESVTHGDEIEFCISAEEAYNIEIYRIGWYDGDGGRLITEVEGSSPQSQDIPDPGTIPGSHDTNDDLLVQCDWEVTDTVTVGDDWVSGLYYARFVSQDSDYSTTYPFVVKEATPSATIVNVLPFNTMAAYNTWGASSLYGNHSWEGQSVQVSDAVSFDQPYQKPHFNHIGYAIHLIRWMEMEGYDVEYLTTVDAHREPDRLQEHALTINSGHSEYWTLEMRNALKDARDSGTNLAFMGGNIGMWRVEYEDDARVVVCNKDNGGNMFRNQGMNDAELVGVMGVGAGLWRLADLTVVESALDHPWMEGTGFSAGDKVVGVVGHEWDRERGASPDLTKFFHYEGGSSQWGGTHGLDKDADAASYEAGSGATVYSCATLGYPRALDEDPTWNDLWPWGRAQEYKPGVNEPDERLQTFQKNMFDDLIQA